MTLQPDDRDLLAELTGKRRIPEWKRLLLVHPDLFIVRYFGHRIDKLEDFHLRLIDTATRRRRGLVLYPAAHGKTTLVSTILPIWRMCRDPNIRQGIIAKTDDEAENIGRVIQAELEDNDELIHDFGPFKPAQGSNKPWGVGGMMVADRTRRAKEPTFAFFGSGARNVLGHRTDATVCDDVVTEKNSSTPEQRSKTREWFNLCVATMGEFEDSTLTVVGTRFDPADLYAELEELVDVETGERRYHVQLEDAIVDEEKKVTLWPGKWTWSRLMGEKGDLGTLDFNKRYRNIAVDKSRMVFKEEYVKGGYIGREHYPGCIDTNYKIGEYEPDWPRAGGFDPAVGLGRQAKFCAHITLAAGSCLDHERCYWVIDIERDQMALPVQANLILHKHQEHELMVSVVEANSYQGGLVQLVQEVQDREGLACTIQPHYTTRTNKPDPETGVQAMAPWFEQGKVHIPWGDATSRRKMQQLVDELVMFPGKTTDTVMAFWFAWRHLNQSGPKFRSYNRLARQAPWARRFTGRRVIQNPYYVRGDPAGDREG